jgi:hypothetical protein
MTRELIFEAETVKLYFHRSGGLLEHELLRYPGAETLEAMLTHGLEMIRSHGISKWLSDDRRGGALPKSHHEWAKTVWGPRAARAGWRYWALVPPKEALGATNMDRLTRVYAKLGVTVEVFESPALGLEWLRHK